MLTEKMKRYFQVMEENPKRACEEEMTRSNFTKVRGRSAASCVGQLAVNLRIVLLGKSLSENIRVRNFILGTDVKENEDYLQNHSVRISGTVENRHISFIHCHLLQPNLTHHQITERVRECVNVSTPGPHVFILILQHQDFSEEDKHRVMHVLNCFSDQAMKRTIVLTTDENTHSSVTSNEFINELINECGGGQLPFDTRQPAWCSEVFRRVEEIIKKEPDEFIISEMYEDAEEETSGDKIQYRLESLVREIDSDYEKGGKSKESNKIRGFPGHSLSVPVSGKSKLNVVLCGTDARIKVTLSKFLRGKMKNSLNPRELSSVCVKKEERNHGYLLNVVELPALTQLSEDEVMRETFHCLSLCDPGVHVFVFIPVGPMNKEDKVEMEKIHKIFGSKDHFMMIFTTEFAVERPVTDFEISWTESLFGLCGGRYKVLALKEHSKSKQIPDLLDYIENMHTEPYSLQMYVRACENEVKHETEKKYKEKLQIMENKIKELEEKIKSESVEDDSEDPKCLRIVLIGRTGSGKSATGNTILGKIQFESKLRSDSVTTVCEKKVCEVDGRSVAVVDTPGLFDTTMSNDKIQEEIVKCVSLSSPGPHAFIIVLRLDRFTREELDTIDLIKKIFGLKAAQFSIILFTRGDDLQGETIEDFVRESKSAELKKLIRDCGDRYLAFNNRETQDRSQVMKLIKMIEEMKTTNQGRYFTNSMFEEAEMSIKKRMEEIMKEKEREIQAEKEELKVKYEKEKENIKRRLETEKQRAEEERVQMEKRFRENEETLKKEFEEKQKTEQQKRDEEKQKQLEEEKQQRVEYDQMIEKMKREIEQQRSQYKKREKERKEEDRKREEKYKQDQENMKREQEQIITELQKKQEEEKKKRDSEEQMRINEEEREREEWERKIKEAENDKKEKIKQQQGEWEEKMKQQMRKREEDEKKTKERHEEQLKEKQEELEKMRKTFEKEKEEERKQREEETQKQRQEREEKEREYEVKKNDMMKHYEKLEQERKEEWEIKKQEDDKRREEERKKWEKMIEDLKHDREAEMMKKEEEEKERKEREEKEREEMKRKHEAEMKQMKKNHVDEARKQAEEFNEFRENKEQQIKELRETFEEDLQAHKTLAKVLMILNTIKSVEVKYLREEVEELQKSASKCVVM